METGEIFDLPDAHTTDLRKCPLYGDILLARTALPACALSFAIDWHFSMEAARARILSSNGAPDSVSDAMQSALSDPERLLYPDNDYGHDWDFADVPVDSQDAVCCSLRRNFDAICKLCRSANVAVLKDASTVLRLALQNLNAITERCSSASFKAKSLERVRIIE